MTNNTKLYNIVRKWNLKEGRYCIDSTIKNPKIKEISNCITARYDAGVQNKQSIGMCVVVVNDKSNSRNRKKEMQ